MPAPDAAALDVVAPAFGPAADLLPAAPAAAGAESRAAAAVQAALAAGDDAAARERFSELIVLLQRRAARIALGYLRNPADADEAVQDAFVRAFTSMPSYRAELPFEHWFSRILVNGCIDRARARQRRERRLLPLNDAGEPRARHAGSPEQRLFARRLREAVAGALDELPERQRSVFVLCHYGDYSAREVGAMTGISESTVRVHLFRAVHKLRAALEDWREAR